MRPIHWTLLALCVASHACDSRSLIALDAALPPVDGSPPPYDTPSATADCPAIPALASACPVEGQVCSYTYEHKGCDDCAVEPTEYLTVLRCTERRWSWVAHRKVDGPPLCPAAAPTEAQACVPAQRGLDCFYSSRDCASGSIVQCDGRAWRELNPCPARAAIACKLGLATSPSDRTTLKLTENYVNQVSATVLPDGACVGIQPAVAHTAFDASWGLSHLYFSWSSSAEPVKPQTHPVLAFGVDRYLLARLARVEGLVVRSVPLRVAVAGEPAGEVASLIIDAEATDVLDLLVSHGRAHLTYAHPSTGGPSQRAVSLATWELDRPQQTLKRTVLFDEANGAMNCMDGGCAIAAHLAASPKGPVVAFVIQGPGDFAYEPPALVIRTLSDSSEVSLDLEMAPDALSLTTLADGSLLVALYTAKPGTIGPELALCDQLRLLKVSGSGAPTKVACPDPLSGPTQHPPRLTAFEDGYLVAWHAGSDRASDGPRLKVAYFDDTGQASMVELPDSATLRGPPALGASPLDRAVHLAWSTDPPNVDSGASGYQLRYQRLVCAEEQ
jgi:hypothetical protein